MRKSYMNVHLEMPKTCLTPTTSPTAETACRRLGLKGMQYKTWLKKLWPSWARVE